MGGGDQHLTCTEGARRLDRWLARQPGIDSRRRATQAVLSGKVEVDGVPVPPEALSLPVPPGTTFVVRWNKPGSTKVARGQHQRRRLGLRVLHEDRDLIVIDKPAGLAVDAPRGSQLDTVRTRLDAGWRSRGQKAEIVHQLDPAVSGCLVVARHEGSAEQLRTQVRDGSMVRTFWALVHGDLPEASGTWSHSMRFDAQRRRQRLVHPDAKGARLAEAAYTADSTGPGWHLIEVRIAGVRRRQILAHLEAEGLHLAGAPDAPPVDVPQLALHITELVLTHPRTGKRITARVPVPDALRDAATNVRSSTPS